MGFTQKKEIALNFLPISNHKFEFTIWCRLSKQSEKKWREDIKQFKLPINGEYYPHWVSFKEFENSKELVISSDTNIWLTKYYLFNLLKQKLSEAGINFIQREREKKFARYHLYIITEETKWGNRAIRFEPYYLKIKKMFGFLVDYKFLKKPDIPFNRKIQQLSFSLDENYRSNINYHIDKYRYIMKFLKSNLPKFSEIRNDIKILSDFQKVEYLSLKIRRYIFGNNSEDNSQFQGINKSGPYKQISVPINYFYIYHKDHKDYVNDLIKALNGKTFKTFKGLTKLGLPIQTKDNTKGLPIKSFNDNLELEKHLNFIQKNSIQNSIVIAIFPSSEEKFYYTLKNMCLQKNIPLQTVHLETILDENKLKWSVSGIALQIFTKLGGIPWIVKTEHSNCLIVGIGQSIERDSKNKPIRFFAYSVLLDSSGKFIMIEPLADAADKSEYLKKVGKKVSEIINEYAEYNKIVFHIPEKISLETIKEIENQLKICSSNIELYIIRVNNDSKFFGYDINNNSLIPYESTYIQLSHKEFLLWTEGLNYHNPTPRKRYSNPIYIDFYYSNQDDIDYKTFLQDILNLSGTNYRGFNAKSLPVSMFYPILISRFYKCFKKYNLHIPTARISKMWFL